MGERSITRPARRTTWASSSISRSASASREAVAAQGEATHLVVDGVPSRQEQDGHLDAVQAHPADDLEAVDVRQHHVQEHHVRGEVLHLAQGVAARAGHADVEAEVAQGGVEQEGDVLLVVDDEHPARPLYSPVLVPGSGPKRSGSRY